MPEFIVTAIERVRARYIVEAETAEEAKVKFEAADHPFEQDGKDEYCDLDEIELVEENK